MRSGHTTLTAGAVAVAVSALVVLAGRLPADAQAPGDDRPSDPQTDRVVDQQGQLGVQLISLQLCPADPFQHLRRWQRDLLWGARGCQWLPGPITPPGLDALRHPP